MQTIADLKLETYRWRNRLILLFAASDSSEAYREQMRYFDQNAVELKDRDLILWHLFENGEGKVGEQRIAAESVTALRERFNASGSDLTVVLIGKDGNEKDRHQGVVEPEQLFELIDTMPMRQEEMNEEENT